jgi:signal transduction histidine kinase
MSDDTDQLRRALEAERTARGEAERRLAELSSVAHANELYARATTVLSETLDLDETLSRVVEVVLPALGDFGFIDVVERDAVRRIPFAHDDPRRLRALDATEWTPSLRTDINVCALSSGEPALHADIDGAWRERVATSPEHLALMQELDFRSMVTVPLCVRGRTLGALTLFHGASGRRHDARDLALAEGVATRVALAIDKAQLYRAAREADRRKDEFLAMLGHELRNPLAPIATAVEIMKLEDPDIHARERKIVERQVGHLVRLVDDLLDVSRITRGKILLDRHLVEASQVVAKAVEQASPMLERYQHHFVQRVPRAGLLLDVDEHRIAQVLSNVLTNAAKYTPPGGKVELSAERDGGTVAFRVKDDGRGIPPELLPRVFELFAQGARSPDRSEGGLGLGLSIAHSLVELHGGTIDAHSEGPGRGSTFTVRLPAGPEQARPLTPVSLEETPKALGLRILLVDDNVDAAELLAEALRRDGNTVEIAHDGPSALEVADCFRPDVALLDLGLPVMDGYELAKRLREKRTGAPLRLVAVTGYGQESDRARSMAAGFEEHLVKPVQLRRLRALLGGDDLAPR